MSASAPPSSAPAAHEPTCGHRRAGRRAVALWWAVRIGLLLLLRKLRPIYGHLVAVQHVLDRRRDVGDRIVDRRAGAGGVKSCECRRDALRDTTRGTRSVTVR